MPATFFRPGIYQSNDVVMAIEMMAKLNNKVIYAILNSKIVNTNDGIFKGIFSYIYF